MADRHLYEDPDYVQGQLAALRSLILGLSKQISKQEFREQSLERLDILKTALLATPVSDARIKAVEACEEWVMKVTE